ncbi:TonB-dependent receptor [Sphingobacterium haloxyli]|uniref:Energy transducer TonB n=1 Tax=Sphingobacterium haloxyli TaxID=2100533 RepID=A0A2S9J4U8_9SPHI|nr:TonB-dependent receptor [Sphingobacterium haloxyli]PRD47795.1 energy transducer TonB [Sphingobacterium haloxyli]
MQKSYLSLLPLVILVLWSIRLNAQTPSSGSLSGIIRNDKGERIQNASLHFDKKEYNTHADTEGEFYIRSLPQGQYRLTISVMGYDTYESSIAITAGKNTAHVATLRQRVSVLDEVSVVGKSGVLEVKETPFNVVALDAKSHYNSTLDLAGLLDKASGVKIRESGGIGSDMNITLNGFTGRNIHVFMDGVPMQGMGSAFQLNNIPVNMAERIEVYKGVVPIEFGADALGGVINIVTNRTRNTTLDASYSIGSFNTHKSNISLNHTFKSGVSLQLNAFQNYSDNDYKVKTVYRIFAEEGNTDDGWSQNAGWSTDSAWFRRFHDTYRNETVMARVGIVGKKWADRMLFGLTLGQEKKDIQHGSEMKYAFGERTAHSKSILPSFVYDKRDLLIEGLSVRVNGNFNYQKGGTVDTTSYKYSWTGERVPIGGLRGTGVSYGEAGYGVTEFTNRNESATANIGYRINHSHSIAINNVATNYTRKPDLADIAQRLYPGLPTAADSMSRSSFQNILGLEYRFSYKRRWNTNLFAKHYRIDASGPQTDEGLTYRKNENSQKTGYGIATTYFFKDVQLKASAEKAYRLPNDRELFGDEILEVGNITLRPEQSNNYNIGFTLNKELNPAYTLYVDWSGYYRDTYDFIQTALDRIGDDLNGISVYRRANHGRVTRLGTDVETRIYYKNVATVGATLTYMDIRDKAKYTDLSSNLVNGNYNYRMPNLPCFFWNVDASYYLHNLMGKGNTLNLNYTFNFVDRIYRNAIAYGDRDTKDFIAKQMYSDFSATYIMKNGRYNVSLEARNLENAMLYDNFSLQKPGRRFALKLRYFFIKR